MFFDLKNFNLFISIIEIESIEMESIANGVLGAKRQREGLSNWFDKKINFKNIDSFLLYIKTS